jgi:superfamily II DNA helicase RecQ
VRSERNGLVCLNLHDSSDAEAVYVNAENKTPELLKRIKQKEYRRIYMGPEQLQCDNIRKILRTDTWSKDLLAYIVDEAHVVVQWGKTFRPVYETLAELRHLDARKVPVMAMSATLPIDVCHELSRKLELRTPTIVNVGSARDNIHLKFRKFKHAMKSFQDIWEAIPELHDLSPTGEYSRSFFRLSILTQTLSHCPSIAARDSQVHRVPQQQEGN